MRLSAFIHSVALLLLVTQPDVVTGFAAWLKCYVDLDDTEIIMNYPVALPEDSDHRVILAARQVGTEEWKTDSVTYPATGDSTSFQIQLQLPDSLRGQDLQYVVETTAGGSFPNPPSICEGRRTHGNYRHTAMVTLQVQNSVPSIEVWGGWATGHSVVTLTPKLILNQEGNSVPPEL